VAEDQNNKATWTDSDRAALDHARAELKEQEHRTWLWASLGRITKWALAAVAGTTVVADAVLRIVNVLKDR
jgi:hypothetical protein